MPAHYFRMGRPATLDPEHMTYFLDLYSYANHLLEVYSYSAKQEQHAALYFSADLNSSTKRRALSTHYSAKDIRSQANLKHRYFLDLKNYLNLLQNQRQQLSSQYQQLNEIIDAHIEPQSVERIMYLQNRLDEQKLRYKEAQSISEIYKSMKEKLVSESVWYQSALYKANETIETFDEDISKAQLVYETAALEAQRVRDTLELYREAVKNRQLANRNSLDYEKAYLRDTLRREDEKFEFKKARTPVDIYVLAAVHQYYLMVKPLFEKMVAEHYAFKNLYEFVYRARMTEFDLLQNYKEAEQSYSSIESEISNTLREIKQTEYENENHIITSKSVKYRLQKQIDEVMYKYERARQAYELLNRTFYQVNVFFMEYDANLQLIKLVTETLDKNAIVLGEAGSQSFTDFCLSVYAKIACLRELMSFEREYEGTDVYEVRQKTEDDGEDFNITITTRAKTANPARAKYRIYDEDKDDELRIFEGLPRDLYDGELPNNCKIRFDSEPVRMMQRVEGIYRSALSDGLRKTRGFRMDREGIKKESFVYAHNVKQAKLREAGYLE